MECYNTKFWIPPPLLVSPWPLHPASLHFILPLVTRVHLRRPSDFSLTLANTVAVTVITKLVVASTSCSCSSFSADFTSSIEVKLSEMFLDDMVRRYTKKLISIHQDRGNQESCSLENWCNLISRTSCRRHAVVDVIEKALQSTFLNMNWCEVPLLHKWQYLNKATKERKKVSLKWIKAT